MLEDWLDFALTAVGGATAFLCLFEGTRRIAAHGVQRKAVFMAALAATFYVVYGGFAYVKYQDLKDQLDTFQQRLIAVEPTAGSVKPLSSEKREASSLARARLAFTDTGTLGNYFDRAGKKRPFVPTQEDVRKRERVVDNLARLSSAARGSFIEAMLWLMTGLLAVFFGFAFSREKAPGEVGREKRLERAAAGHFGASGSLKRSVSAQTFLNIPVE